MGNDIRPPKPRIVDGVANGRRPQQHLPRPVAVRTQAKSVTPTAQSTQAPASIEAPSDTEMRLSDPVKPAAKKPFKRWPLVIAAAMAVFACIIAVFVMMLGPVNANDTNKVHVSIPVGATQAQISKELQEKGLIKNQLVFDIYLRFTGARGKLQAGDFRLSPSESAPQIAKHLQSGKLDTTTITFFPGATLTDTSDKDLSKKSDVTSVLKRAGYSDNEIREGLTYAYQHPVLKDKPAAADLEGYIYGETYEIESGASVQQVITRTLDQLYSVIKDNDLEAGFKKHGLNLYQGITLASIVQREVSNPTDTKQVAQVFLKRLDMGIQLGSDVTFIYGAHKLGVEPTVDLNSPYNTRKLTGLPPGPIAAPGEAALVAVSKPAPGDYLYFVAGDDGKTYFAHTEAEHDDNAAKYCKKLCSMF